jgi:hypothetical protein
MTLADRADAAMGDLLRSYAVSLLTERVIYARSPLQLDGKPIKSDLEGDLFVLGKALDLALNPPEEENRHGRRGGGIEPDPPTIHP